MNKTSTILLFLLFSYIIWQLLIVKTPYIFIDNVNLLFHEGGHMIFLPFGQFMHVLGGSLTQCLIPLLVLFHFVRREDWNGSLFSFFWFGENLINVSYYISDAEKQILPLIGGGGHDWNYLLGRMNLLSSAEVLGSITFYLGACVILTVYFISICIALFNFLSYNSLHK